METEVRIVDRCLQECENLFTTTNRRVKGNKEIDILAFDPRRGEAFHYEVCVLFRPLRLEETVHKSSTNRSRDSVDYFISGKFDHKEIKRGISEILGPGIMLKKRVLVVGRIKEDEETRIREEAREHNIEIKLIGEYLQKLKTLKSGSRDDVVRTLELSSKYI